MKTIKIGKKYIRGILILICTIIANYGIFTAPKSDKQTLEQELMQNQQILQQTNAVEIGRASCRERVSAVV